MSLLKSKFTINEIEQQLNKKGLFQEFIDNLLDERYIWLDEIYKENNNNNNNLIIHLIILPYHLFYFF